jgi:chromate reductase, NAD(P)H dehydrogenase (quinone)
MKILAFAGSNSSGSINLQFAKYALVQFAGDEHHVLDLNDYEMPLFSVDREKQQGYPEQAKQFIRNIRDCDALVVSLAEHNRSFTAAFKNIVDWCSRLDREFYAQKPMILLSTSPGGYGGGNVMAQALGVFPKLGAHIVASFSLPYFGRNFTEGEGITDPALRMQFMERIEILRSVLLAESPGS